MVICVPKRVLQIYVYCNIAPEYGITVSGGQDICYKSCLDKMYQHLQDVYHVFSTWEVRGRKDGVAVTDVEYVLAHGISIFHTR